MKSSIYIILPTQPVIYIILPTRRQWRRSAVFIVNFEIFHTLL